MPPEVGSGLRNLVVQNRGLIFPVLIVALVLIIIAPLPPVLMDLLLACNITAAVVILLTTIYVQRPLDFSVFPAILLGTTLARLVLNVASTRLILTNAGSHGTGAAGGVIEAFGEFVASGNVVIGLIIFVILLTIQFLVVTKGATRISEVTARFALDGMPGKQMAIEADLTAGLTDQHEAKLRRDDLTRQADFYGAMDGASKFVRGDAVASIVITMVNIVGGLFVGMAQNQMTLGSAVEVFTTLTIGDGLVTQVPAFLISLAAGLIVTRTSAQSDLPGDVVGQVLAHPEALFLAAGFLMSLSLTGLPAGPLVVLGTACVAVGIALRRSQKNRQERPDPAAAGPAEKPQPQPEDRLSIPPLELEFGVGLISLADPAAGGDLLDRVTQVRQVIAQDMGIILPKVRIRDNLRLPDRRFQIRIRDVPVAWGDARTDALLAYSTADRPAPPVGTPAPGFGPRASWIEPAQRSLAERAGCRVVSPAAAIAERLTDLVRQHAAELLNRQQVHQLLDNLKKTAPRLVDELVPHVLGPAQIHQVLSNLLNENVPVRDLETILETLSDYADRTQNLTLLTEYARTALARSICQQYRDLNQTLHVISFDAALEDVLAAGFDFGERDVTIKLSHDVRQRIVALLKDQWNRCRETAAGQTFVVLCGPLVRAGLRQVSSNGLPELPILSLNEITRDTQLQVHGEITARDVFGDSSHTSHAARAIAA